MVQLYVHIEGLETALVEVDEMPKTTDTLLICKNPQRRDGKPVPYLLQEVNIMIIPLSRIVFIEVMTVEAEEEFDFIRE